MDQIGLAQEKQREEIEKVKKAIESSEVEKIYFNGVSCSLGPGDVAITIFRNGQSIKVLNTSYTMAKSLSENLSKLIQVLENVTQNKIMTSEFINQKLTEKKT
jgi:TATA-box binding protein (TBP) (component of TFIID and TFIIIB)